MRFRPRKTAPRVVRGKVRKKNRAAPTSNYWNTPQDVPVIDRRRPGDGHRHVLKKRDVLEFIEILPDWAELSKGLDAILLATADPGCDGWHVPGIVAICAWERELWRDVCEEYYDEHQDIFQRLGVPCGRLQNGNYRCEFNEEQARAYQLLHILLHELGHHHDRMTTRSRADAARGENYAEQYARRHEALIWKRYVQKFRLACPAGG